MGIHASKERKKIETSKTYKFELFNKDKTKDESV
jgi:hypothetical protein